jgi:mono/diheme cytochrome c family protein
MMRQRYLIPFMPTVLATLAQTADDAGARSFRCGNLCACLAREHRVSAHRVLAIPVAVALTFTMCAVSGQTTAVPSLLAGAYTEAQALRGQALYYERCLACHAEDMSGLDQAPPLTGPQFSGTWQGESLWDLVVRIDTMPPSAPGSLSRAETVDLLTYVLWYNGLPLGEMPLSDERSVLAAVIFETPPPGR